MIHRRPRRSRRGFALTIVLITLILLFALWSFVYRTTSGLLRIETNRALQQTRDTGVMNTLGRALQLLQYGPPSDSICPSATSFHYYISGWSPSYDYSVVYTAPPNSTAPANLVQYWQVQVNQVPQGSLDSSYKPLPSGLPPAWPAGAGK
jgi:hypothetical protein